MNSIKYPYLPEGREIKYVPADNQFMKEAKQHARQNSKDKVMPNSSVIVKNEKIIARGANGSDYHDTHECERVKRKIPTGQGYELCEGCHPKNHGELRAIADANDRGVDIEGADLYLWGHWWCCESCWNAMIKAGIKGVYLLEGSEKFFNPKSPENIVGRQFQA